MKKTIEVTLFAGNFFDGCDMDGVDAEATLDAIAKAVQADLSKSYPEANVKVRVQHLATGSNSIDIDDDSDVILDDIETSFEYAMRKAFADDKNWISA